MKKTNIYYSLLGRPLFVGLPPIMLTLIDKRIIKPIMNPPVDFGILDNLAFLWLGIVSPVWFFMIMRHNDPVERGSGVLMLIAIVVSSVICFSIIA